MKLCTLLTVIFSLIPFKILIGNPKPKYAKFAIFNIAMSFFFFSYHVHEKTIILPLAGNLLLIRYFGIYSLDFTMFGMFSLFSLLKEDGLVL